MTDTLGRLRDDAADFVALLVVWVLFSFTVGSAIAGILGLTAYFEPVPLETPLVVAGLAVAVLELLDRRPTLRRTVTFTAADLLLALLVLLPVAVGTREAALLVAIVDLATTAIAAWVVFAVGYRRVIETSRTILYRLTRRGPTER